MCFIVDHSGKVGRTPTIKDVIANQDASQLRRSHPKRLFSRMKTYSYGFGVCIKVVFKMNVQAVHRGLLKVSNAPTRHLYKDVHVRLWLLRFGDQCSGPTLAFPNFLPTP